MLSADTFLHSITLCLIAIWMNSLPGLCFYAIQVESRSGRKQRFNPFNSLNCATPCFSLTKVSEIRWMDQDQFLIEMIVYWQIFQDRCHSVASLMFQSK